LAQARQVAALALGLGPGDAIFAAQCHGAIGGVDDPAGVLAPPWSDRAD
jgi:hypothetical protein